MEIDNQADSKSISSSLASTPGHPPASKPFQSLFKVTFTDAVSKDGHVIKYTLKTIPTCGPLEPVFVVQREYEDLEWLEHCLTTSRCVDGLIIPPLPAKPAMSAPMAEAKSRKQLGNSSKKIIGDEFYKDCRMLEQYLNSLLSHTHFGRDPQLKDFLTKPEPPVTAIVKKSFLNRISEKMEILKSTHKDCEEFFHVERDWNQRYGQRIKEASENFNNTVYSEQRLCDALSQLSTVLNLSVGNRDGYNALVHKLMARFSDGLNDFKHSLEDHSFTVDSGMGVSLDLFSRHVKAEEDTLLRRMCLMVDYENSNRALDKAKGNKRDLAEIAKLEAERAFEDCSDTARQEIKHFHRQRVTAFQLAIADYATAQLRTANHGLTAVTAAILSLQHFQTPQPPKINCQFPIHP